MKLIARSNAMVHIELSRRNILALLHKLDKADSARTIFQNFDTEDGDFMVVISVVEDLEHYLPREMIGPMTPDIEAFIQGNTPVQVKDYGEQ